MNITGIICEYNPLHSGHKKQLDIVRSADPDGGIVCLMSGNFVQRGMPSIFHKSLRAEAAVRCGADLVLELPVTVSLQSAEGFAAGGVSILSGFCNKLCFGAENADGYGLADIAGALLSQDFKAALRGELDKGLSFPAARQAALEAMGFHGDVITSPNNILAVEYCKAILSQGSALQPWPIHREGNYHDSTPDSENPSATALRQLMDKQQPWQSYVPEEVLPVFENADMYSIAAGERAIVSKLRTMTDQEFQALPYGAEGLWRKLMHAARKEATLEEILTATKTKRYTRSRLDRMVMCAFLGLREADLQTPAPYVRVLAFNDKGREILKKARAVGEFPNIGQQMDHPYQQLENRCGTLYGLFRHGAPDAPDMEAQQRVFYQK